MKKYIYIAIGVIVAVLLSLYIGKSIGEKNQKEMEKALTVAVCYDKLVFVGKHDRKVAP